MSLKLSGVLLTEFLKDWQAFVNSEDGGINSFDLAERFWVLGRKSVSAEIEIELEETEYGKKLRHEKTLPSEIEIERAYYKVFFKERENFSNNENLSWLAGAKTATKVFFQILKGKE
jgi:hypothetical protein